MEDSGLGGGEWAFILIVLGVAVAIGIVINAIVCWLTSSALSSVPSEHREMEPGLVWLLLIPCFGVFWSFFVFPKVARSFRRAFEARGETRHGDCGVAIGWWIAICAVLGGAALLSRRMATDPSARSAHPALGMLALLLSLLQVFFGLALVAL